MILERLEDWISPTHREDAVVAAAARRMARSPARLVVIDNFLIPQRLADLREGLAQALTRVPHFWPQHLWTHHGLDPAEPLHFIGRFERLETDFNHVLERLGLPDAPALPHLRSVEHGDYAGWYDAGARAVVAELYSRDIALFGYRFGA